ncbi:RNA degradosome polyphosphate kinase [Campylobacter canadensis]|uniref:Polyphosphate kinase n=1 Tax=Campylobacter canadensis TaxID=449520 RepID=A0ABS7WRG0_9BACT|nr:RNA degradosome polyphosphate kinase [Campylobacter canadensis]MBZ7987346.1 RNA degradosome polyphosphate kinase [Campylobacter canadensis]MBZ7994771.1 RNA degradosome polyphosphate kinase [Campylobacter canadensis]MBZ7996521.1 RNA degradosome polyphosphate kinase [Campylobacter canadensis]MBZ7998483.1 RNA degradosome polyphosphate kinase [Campylobacter canadensis]MBZ8000197.1 RNA degradosome polyphosphate kinase [Campylobacter canadensis]
MKRQMVFNRELSWLRFNSRVLEQCSKKMPILDRLRFISIYCTNLDEFYMIRVAGLKQLFASGVVVQDEMPPLEQLNAIREYLHNEKELLEKYYFEILKELNENSIYIKNYDELSRNLKGKAKEYFFSTIMPVIVPIAVDSTHPFPPLNNLSFSLAVKLKSDDDKHSRFAMVRIPRVLPRFFEADNGVFVPIESIVKEHAEDIFPGYKLELCTAFRVTRNADIVIEEEEADDFMMLLEQGLKLRRKGAYVRIQIENGADIELKDFLSSHLKVFNKDIYEYKTLLSLSSIMQIVNHKQLSHLCAPSYVPKILPPFDENVNIFDVIEKQDILCYQPYESFDPVASFIKEAAKDTKTISIRMTLYRLEKNSQIIKALMDAANDGKQVTVMVELKARFDEENNLYWAKELENAGAHVVYGIAGFKVHAKITQIIRQMDDGTLKFYAHLGTGNYNSVSAKVYTDISFFTSNKDIANTDITAFFNILTGYCKNKRLKTLAMSPFQIKEQILRMIKTESLAGKKGEIIMKMNSLVDTDIIKALYEASNKGVSINLIVRGICCLRPNVKGFSENIRVISIVGKYLEHARIFYFKHANPQYFISSADMMPRNLERRLELMTPIFNESLSAKLAEILRLQLSDNQLAYILNEDGVYKKIENDEKAVDSQAIFENYISGIYKSYKKGRDKAKADQMAQKFFREN